MTFFRIVFPKNHIDDPVSSHANFTLTNEDKEAVRRLKQFWEMSGRSKGGFLSKATLLKDLQLNSFTDCVAQVVGIYKFGPDANHCVLKVSDGTKVCYSSYRQTGQICTNNPALTMCNEDLVNATKDHSYDISLFDDHLAILDNLKVGDYIVLSNLHVKSVIENDYFKAIIEDLQLEEVCFYLFSFLKRTSLMQTTLLIFSCFLLFFWWSTHHVFSLKCRSSVFLKYLTCLGGSGIMNF